MSDAVLRPFKRQVYAHPKFPAVEQTSHSYAMLLRDAIIDRLKASAFFNGFHFVRTKNYQVQAQDVPHCGVFFIDESFSGDGDINAGEPRLSSAATIGFSIIVQNNDPEAAEEKLDYAFQAVGSVLLRDPTLFLANQTFQVEGVRAGKRVHVFGNAGKDNELPIAELQLTLIYDLGALTFDPRVPDIFETMHVTTRVNDDPIADPIISEYDVEQNK
jgi:hypothetical protein